MKRKLDKKERIHFLSDEESQIFTNRVLIANALNDHFSSVFEMESKDEPMQSFESRTNEALIIDLILQKLSAFEVDNRLRKLDGRKAFGYDKVHLLVLKKCSRALAISLSIIFEKSLTEGKIPNMLRFENVSPTLVRDVFMGFLVKKQADFRETAWFYPCKELSHELTRDF